MDNANSDIAKHIKDSSLASRVKEASSFCDAALIWFSFGFQVIPIIEGTKKPAVKWDPWLSNLSEEKIVNYWTEHPKHEIAAIVGDGTIAFDMDTEEAKRAMAGLEEKYNMSPSMVVETDRGTHHYFKSGSEIVIKADSHSTTGTPERIDIKTGRNAIMLPPSTGKRLLFAEANHADELAPASQDFIDAVFVHNGRSAPSVPNNASKKIRKEGEVSSSLSSLKLCLFQIGPDIGYQDWFKAIAVVHHETQGSDEGLELVDTWSSKGEKYEGLSDVETTWNSLRSNHGSPLTIATLFSLAIDNVEPFERCEMVVIEPVRRAVQDVDDYATALEPKAINKNLENASSSKSIQVPSMKKQEVVSNSSADNVNANQHLNRAVKSKVTALKKPSQDSVIAPHHQDRSLIDKVEKLNADFFPNHPETEHGSPDITLANVAYMLRKYNIVARYNLIKKKSEFLIGDLPMIPDTMDNSTFAYIKSLANLNNMGSSDVLKFAETVCSSNPHNPILEWIMSEPWDGKNRLPEIYETLETEENFPEVLKMAIIKR
jgi:hypothetical protein